MTKHVSETETEFTLLTIEEIEQVNPDAAEAIREMDPVEQEGAIEFFSEKAARDFEKAVEQKKQQGAEKLQDLLSQQTRTELKDKFSVVTSAVADLGRSAKSATKEGVQNAKEAYLRHQAEKEVREEKVQNTLEPTEAEVNAKMAEIRRRREAEARENGDPDVTVVA